jgi:DNA repair protein RadC
VHRHCPHLRIKGAPVPRATAPIREWSAEERPRERLLAGQAVSPAELLAIILRTGNARESAVELARRLLVRFESLHRLAAASPGEISEVNGIGPAKAAMIRAALELGRRASLAGEDPRDGLPQASSSQAVFDCYRARFATESQEVFLLLTLNNKNRITREVEVSRGTLNASIVHPRDVFKAALREAAGAVIFVHNHPSGDPAPSAEDRALTRRLAEAGKLLGITVLDHVIIGSKRCYSFRDNGDMD